MKYYYALFKETAECVEVEFPDLTGCVTFGADWDEALQNATDALAAWLANAEPQFIKKPSPHRALAGLKGTLIPIQIDEDIIASYQKLIRFNVIFPAKELKRIDTYRKKIGLKRSTFFLIASEEYLQHHAG